MLKERHNVTATMYHMQYQYNFIAFDPMNDDVIAYGEAS